MKHKRNGWAKARTLVSDYLLKNQGKPGIKNVRDLLMPARKFLAGYTGTDANLTVAYFESYLDGDKSYSMTWPALDALNKRIEEKRLGSDALKSDILVELSDLINRVGSIDLFDKYLSVVKSIKDL